MVQDSLGNVVPQVLCSVLLEGTGTLATLWQDDAGTIPMSNPMTSDATYGSFDFYVTPAHYDLTFTKPGYVFQPLLDMQVPQDDLTLGTMAQQDASAVVITGGNAALTALGLGGYGADPAHPLNVQGHSILNGQVSINTASVLGRVSIEYPIGAYCLWLKQIQAGTAYPALFLNSTSVVVGSITHSDTATAFNTTSDSRLKHAIAPLTGALDVVRALNPVSYLWNADDSAGRGFVASEVQQIAPEAVTGEPDAVDAEGKIVPQGLDMSKLVPYLCGAVQDLAQQVQVLTARLEAAGA